MNNKICELVGRLAEAPQVFIYQHRAATSTIEVIGQFGFHHASLTPDWHIAAIDTATSRALAFPDTSLEPSLRQHPLLHQVPFARSLLVLRLPVDDQSSGTVMVIVNPNASVFQDHDKITALLLLAQVVAPGVAAPQSASTGTLGFYEPGNPRKGEKAHTAPMLESADQSAAAFLLRTLPKKHRLLSRNGIAFTAVRTWRTALKEFQIAALKSIKEQPDRDGFADLVAGEMAEAINSQLGSSFFAQVVPIPGGSSGRVDAFSVRVAERLAVQLQCPMKIALRSDAARGSSHPKKSARLGEYQVTESLAGATLVVDDVISSGRHMELALKALRGKGGNCFAIGWIAN